MTLTASEVVAQTTRLDAIEPELIGTDDLAIHRIKLDGRRADASITGAITDGSIELTIEGASVVKLTVDDPSRTLIQSRVLRARTHLELDGRDFSLVRIGKTGDTLSIDSEDLIINELRRQKKPRKAYRDQVTRAEFVGSLLRELGRLAPDFYCPELHDKQPIQGATHAKIAKAKAKATKRKPGFSPNAVLTVKGRRATSSQRQVMEECLAACKRVGASPRATLALMEAVTVECEFRNVQGSGADSISYGVIQNIPGRSVGINGTMTKAQALDVDYSVRSALLPPGPTSKGGIMKLMRENPSWSPGAVAAKAINGGGDPDYAHKCDSYRAEALKAIDAYNGGTYTPSTAPTRSKTERYAFARKKGENSWTCIQRLAAEVGWRAFLVGRTFWFISEEDLYRSAPRATLREGEGGVDNIDFDWDAGHPLAEGTVTARAERWAIPVGTCVEVDGLGVGDGRWIVTQYTRSLFSDLATITIKKPIAELPEPKPESVASQSSAATGSNPRSSGSSSDAVSRKGYILKSDNVEVVKAWNKAWEIHARHYPYVWGGGHTNFKADRGTGRDPGIGYDCSGSVGAVLHAAGLLSSPEVSGAMERWGDGGRGKAMTVYASTDHVFMEFETNKGTLHFGTGNWGKGWGGPGFNPNLHPHGGFAVRHYRGT